MAFASGKRAPFETSDLITTGTGFCLNMPRAIDAAKMLRSSTSTVQTPWPNASSSGDQHRALPAVSTQIPS